MAARGPRAGKCPPGGTRAGPSRPALTRTEVLRQGKTAAVVQKEPRGTTKGGRGGCPGPRTGLAKVGPPPTDPKKVDFKRPGETKAMQMRRKAAEEKLKRDAAAQLKLEEAKGRPRRTPAPVGGDARNCREKSAPAGRGARGVERIQKAISQGHVTAKRGGDPAIEALEAAVARGHVVTDRRGAPKKTRGGPGVSRKGPLATATPIPPATQQLAKSMNAQVVQAVPLSDGPIDKIIIEPGVISDDRNTIVCITRPGGRNGAGPSNAGNKSIQMINQSLDEQDAAERAVVQGKLEDLQQARREFVTAITNVGTNAVNNSDESDLSILDLDNMSGACLDYIPTPPRPTRSPRRLVDIPDLSDEMFQPVYGLDHPQVQAGRDFTNRLQAEIDQRAGERRIEEGFMSKGRQQCDDLRLDLPFEQDLMEGDISFEEDDEGHMIPCESRIKASMPPIPIRNEPCAEPPITIEELQRFMDLEKYPQSAYPTRPPAGRADLNPDLWELEDPWFFEQDVPQCDGPDLIEFEYSDLISFR